MKAQLQGTELLFGVDIRDLLNTPEIRETVVSFVATKFSCVLVRNHAGVGLLIRDDQTGNVVGTVPMVQVVADTLQAGTLTHNAAKAISGQALLDELAVQLAPLASIGEPEEGFEAVELQRPVAVERELEASLAAVG